MIGIIVLSEWLSVSPDRSKPPTVSRDSVRVEQVVRDRFGPNTLAVERPAWARERAVASVFVVGADGEARRVTVRYGRVARPLIEIVGGVSAEDRLIVSDMTAWDQFERLRLQ